MPAHRVRSRIALAPMGQRGAGGVAIKTDEVGGLTEMLDRFGRDLDRWISQLPVVHPAAPDEYTPDVAAAYQRLKAGIGRSSDVLMRRVLTPACPEPVLVACVDGLADTQMVDQDIILPLLATSEPPRRWGHTALTPVHIRPERRWPALLTALAGGSTLVFAPALPFVWVVDTVKYPARPIERPQTELAVRGPEEAFNEVLLTQKNQLRRRLATPALQFHDVSIGRVQHMTASVAYLDGLTNAALVQTAVSRLRALDVDGVANATQVAGLIRDHPWSAFPTLRATERVDIVVWRLLEGAVAILVDGDPFVLLAPAPLVSFYRTSMDYSTSWADASFTRLIRFAGWVLALYLPALYIALSEVNPSLLPGSLLIIMDGNHAGLPFSPLVEIILMILVIEILREAAIRLPKVLSTTLGTVGAIVVGTAVVRAGLVDPQVIVMMTLTALSLFSTPVYELVGAWRLWGFALLVGGAILGLLGVVLVTMVALAVVMDMESFGVPYFTPWAPFRSVDWSDAMMRIPWTGVTRRWQEARPQSAQWRRPKPAAPRPHLLKAKRRHD